MTDKLEKTRVYKRTIATSYSEEKSVEDIPLWQLVSQTKVVSLLQRSLEAGTLAHAYLIVGPAQVGKMTLALNLAQALNCPSKEPPCLECPSCQKIASAGHADVQEEEIRIAFFNGADRFQTILRFSDDLNDIVRTQYRPQPFPEYSLVFSYDYSFLFCHGRSPFLQ